MQERANLFLAPRQIVPLCQDEEMLRQRVFINLHHVTVAALLPVPWGLYRTLHSPWYWAIAAQSNPLTVTAPLLQTQHTFSVTVLPSSPQLQCPRLLLPAPKDQDSHTSLDYSFPPCSVSTILSCRCAALLAALGLLPSCLHPLHWTQYRLE